MYSKKIWCKYSMINSLKFKINRVSAKLFHKNFDLTPQTIKQKLMNFEDTQEFVRQLVLDGKPAMVARFGSNEAMCTAEGIGVKIKQKRNISDRTLHSIHINAGVFPYGEEMAMRFCDIYAEAAKKVDLLGWWSTNMQDYLTLEICDKNIKLAKLSFLEPYFSDNPWTAALKGKKVLVIHPFKESIEKQYKKRKDLFNNPDVLPDFELKVIKAVQTIAGEPDPRFKDWEEALVYMCEEAMAHEFDVAIIGCGAYGMPLAAKLKQKGKVAIHLGGATQLLFGIKGGRWDNTIGKKIYNEHWIRPLESEVPNAFKKVENGCYW